MAKSVKQENNKNIQPKNNKDKSAPIKPKAQPQQNNPALKNDVSKPNNSEITALLSAKYNQRSVKEYLDCFAYLQKDESSETKKELAKLRNQALTFMRSIIDPIKKSELPMGTTKDFTKYGRQFIEIFGADAKGNRYPAAQMLQDWLDLTTESSKNKIIKHDALKKYKKKSVDTSYLRILILHRKQLKAVIFIGGFIGASVGTIYGIFGAVFMGILGAAIISGFYVFPRWFRNYKIKRINKLREAFRQSIKDDAKR